MKSKIESKQYCVVIQIGKTRNIGKVTMSAPSIIAMIERWSSKDTEQVFRSFDGQLFGYFFRTIKPLAMMRAEFQTLPATDNEDSIFIFEVEPNADRIGFSQPASWLLRAATK